MQVNALIAKAIVEKNPGREFYLEESFPLEWMYPHLSPHGLILKLEKQPLAVLSETVVERDRDYWKRYAKELIGDWVTYETTVKEICDFGEKVFLRKDLGGFAGDAVYARNKATAKTYSKLRSAIGGIYAWRAGNAESASEKERMLKEADFAFRQALAFCPFSKETAERYVNLLLHQKRGADAELVANLFLVTIRPTNSQKSWLSTSGQPSKGRRRKFFVLIRVLLWLITRYALTDYWHRQRHAIDQSFGG